MAPAREWVSLTLAELQSAADRGIVEAQFWLGLHYMSGLGGLLANPVVGLSWWRSASEQGYSKAQCTLGVQYESGLNVPQDYAEAARLYRLAADQGDAQAQFNLGMLYSLGKGLNKDLMKAAEWNDKAAAQGHKKAQELQARSRIPYPEQFTRLQDEWQNAASRIVSFGLGLTDVATEMLVPSKPALKAWLTEKDANAWKFHMAIISIGVNYAFTQADLSRETSGALLARIKENISVEPRLGPPALTHFDKFMSAWWALAHHPDPDNFDLGGFIGAWFLMSIGVSDVRQCDIVLLRGLAAYMAGPHFPEKLQPRQ